MTPNQVTENWLKHLAKESSGMETAQHLIDQSAMRDERITHYPQSQSEFNAIYDELLTWTDDDCEPEDSESDSRSSVILWGLNANGDSWKVELVRPAESDD